MADSPLSSSPWRGRVAFFALGVLVTWGTFLLTLHWMELVRFAYQSPFMAFDAQPAWLKGTRRVLGYSPWLVGGGVLVARLVRGKRIRIFSYAAGACLVYVGLVLSLLSRPIFDQVINRLAFDPTRWRVNQTVEGYWPDRLRMVNDLLDNYHLTGQSRDSVESLLGPRDSTAYWRDWDMVYWLGPERGLLSIDSEWLVLRVDSSNRVTEYRLVRD